jgi:hypothetical protein
VAARTFWTAADLLSKDWPEPRWAIPGVVCEGVTLLAGQPKVGKSWLSLNLAVAVASGGIALGKVNVDEGDVLYLALEDTPRRLASRLRKVLGDELPPGRLSFDTAWPALTDGGSERLDRWFSDHPGARLVVVDVFARIRGRAPDQQTSAYDADYLAMGALKTLADKHGVAVIVVHHTRKAASEDFLNEVSGTNGLAGSADAVLVLKRMRGSADAELHVTGRDVDESAYALSFAADVGIWTMLDGPAADYTLGDTRRRILDYIREHESATPKQLAEALTISHATAKQTCWRMSKDGQLDTDGQGTYLPISTVTPVTAVTDSDPHTLSFSHLALVGDKGDAGDTPLAGIDNRGESA